MISNFWIYTRYIKYSYSIEIDSQEYFEIEIPFPLNEDGYIGKIFDNLKVVECSTSCSVKINESDHRVSLMIKGENFVKLESKLELEGDVPKQLNYHNLSMTNYNEREKINEDRISMASWFYSNNSNLQLKFNFKYRDGFHRGHLFKSYWGSFGEWEYSGALDKGWQLVKIKGFDAEA